LASCFDLDFAGLHLPDCLGVDRRHLEFGHAAVHMVTKIGSTAAAPAGPQSDLFFMATFAVVAAGGFWVLYDMWAAPRRAAAPHSDHSISTALLSALSGVLNSIPSPSSGARHVEPGAAQWVGYVGTSFSWDARLGVPIGSALPASRRAGL
jgi:hypothetical protein